MNGYVEPRIDLVAVSYNARAETEAMLQSASLNISIPFTLMIVDNQSPDPAMSPLLDRAVGIVKTNPACVRVNVLRALSNQGYARACNRGAQFGTAPYLALLNCDIQFLPGQVERIVDCFERDDYQDVGVIGPRTTTSGGMLTHAGIVATPNGRDGHRFWLTPDSPHAHDELDVPTVSGATYFMRRKVWEELTACEIYQKVSEGAPGAFLPTQHFYEETWCSYHARAHGWRVRYQGDAHLIHEWHRSSPVGSISLKAAEAQFKQACDLHDIRLTF
jgi:GT2 family glycosyltransferase